MSDVNATFYFVITGGYYLGNSIANIKSVSQGRIWAFKALQIINREPEIKIDAEESIKIDNIEEDIIFDNVKFKYRGKSEYALNGISLKFKRNQMTALVGKSGWGKSTIARLLERFYDPQEGNILVNNFDLKEINLREYRRKIGFVSQEPKMLQMSIEDNLKLSKPDATKEEITQALIDALAYDFINELPDGINTEVGGFEDKLSGGEKQRISIARILLRNPDLLILDEATSALDAENQSEIKETVANVLKNRKISIVVITHRLSTIKDADNIYVLQQGNIIEEGTHDDLIDLDKVYAKYWQIEDHFHKVKIDEFNSMKAQSVDSFHISFEQDNQDANSINETKNSNKIDDTGKEKFLLLTNIYRFV